MQLYELQGEGWYTSNLSNEINKLLFSNLWKTGSEIIVHENRAVSLPWGSYLNMKKEVIIIF